MASGGVSGDQYIDFKAGAYVLYNGVLFIPQTECACSLKHYDPSQRPHRVPGSALCFFKDDGWEGVQQGVTVRRVVPQTEGRHCPTYSQS